MVLDDSTDAPHADGHTLDHGDDQLEQKSVVLHRHLGLKFQPIVKMEGPMITLKDGRVVFDATCGAAVSCLGYGEKRVIEAITKQLWEAPYCATMFYTTDVYEKLARFLVDSTHGHMARAYIVNSGSEAMETAIKLARQYFIEIGQPQRTRFIARDRSYHGITLGALAVGGHQLRKAPFKPLLMDNVSHVSPCYAYRGKKSGETDFDYVARLAKELDDEFTKWDGTVCAFVAEPVVGAALGCVPWVTGYFEAVRAVCDKHGALLILDEVMCGMGRSGTLHAWEQTCVVPDIQTMGKGLGGGYQPVAAVMANHRVIGAFEQGSKVFVHGQTYQGHPAGCAAALQVQRIVRDENLVENVREMGALLSRLLEQQLGSHPHVGDIRGKGLFWGIELVADKAGATPFPLAAQVAAKVSELGLSAEYGICVYPCNGTADGRNGDHVILAPPYNVTRGQVEMVAATVTRLVNDFFAKRVAS